jgi:hypothetical protein
MSIKAVEGHYHLPGTHHTFVGVIPPVIAEISMLVYLLVIGVKTVKLDERILAAA